MNFTRFFYVVILGSLLSGSVSAQGLKGRWGLGVGFGAQQMYSDVRITPFGMGGEGFLTYRLTDKISLSLVAGYNQLGFQLPPSTATFTTDLIYGNLVIDYEFLRLGRFRPFVMAGFGGFNFKVGSSTKRYNDAEGLLGGGVRFFLTPTLALMLSGNAKYTTGDDLDAGRRGNKINDAYFTARGGVTFYFGPKTTTPQEELFTGDKDIYEVEGEIAEGEGEETELGEILNRLPDVEEGTAAGGQTSATMEEYLRLRSRIDELNQAIEQKEREIYNLRQEIASRQGTINAIEQTSISSPRMQAQTAMASNEPVVVRDITTAYEDALNKFYSRRYLDAIRIFEEIIRTYPRHSLASYSQYWIGESYYQMQNYRAAIDAFKRVLDYERSLKRDDALFMMGSAYFKLGEKQLAQSVLDQLLAQYPNSEYVEKAMELIRKL